MAIMIITSRSRKAVWPLPTTFTKFRVHHRPFTSLITSATALDTPTAMKETVNNGNLRFHGVALRLRTLPSEVVQKVLNDLSVIVTLELLVAHPHSPFEQLVLSHPQLTRLLAKTPDKFAEIKAYFKLYYDIIHAKRGPNHPNIAALKRDPIKMTGIGEKEVEILAEIKTAILKELDPFVKYIPVLRSFSPGEIEARESWNVQDVNYLRTLWHNLHEGEKKLNLTKSQQLNRIADLIDKYPHLLISSSNLSQARMKNTAHVSAMYRQSAVRMLKPQMHSDRLMSVHIFGSDRLPVVPHDSTLVTLLRILKKFPLEPERNILTGEPLKPLSYDWSEHVRSDWVHVLAGLAYVYTKKIPHQSAEEVEKVEKEAKGKKSDDGSNDDDVMDEDENEGNTQKKAMTKAKKLAQDKKSGKAPLRTLHTPYSDWKERVQRGTRQPEFVGRWINYDVRYLDAIEPMDEQEFEWLEVYLKLATFIKTGMNDVPWSEAVSVSAFWDTHAGE